MGVRCRWVCAQKLLHLLTVAREKFTVGSFPPDTSIPKVALHRKESVVCSSDDCRAKIDSFLDMGFENIEHSLSDIGEGQRQDLEIDTLVLLPPKG